MKRFLLFTLILVSKTALACGFYPYGEELRFSFFNPKCMGYYSYAEFDYSANSFYPGEVYRDFDELPNEKLWMLYCKNKVPYKDIREVLDGFSSKDIQANSENKMIQYLYRIKDTEAINYLKFAKECEYFNSWMDDPWERNEVVSSPLRNKLLNKAIQFSKLTKSEELKFRYTFLGIRLAFYEHDVKKIKELFDSVYQSKKNKDILYYWSLYFRTLAEEDKALANYFAAQVFVNAPDKRFMIAQQYNNEVPIEEVLQYAKTNQERANIYLLAGIKRPDRTLTYLQKIYELNPKFEGLSFLLMREINKMEDWIFTPYYSLFEPTVTTEYEAYTTEEVLKRVDTDRAYALEVMQFLNSVKLNAVENPTLWKTCKAYLSFINRDFNSCLSMVAALENNQPSENLKRQLEILKALALTANQERGKAIILDDVKPIILKNKGFKKFIFALGRELEYNGNTSDAAALYSTMGDAYSDYDEENSSYNNSVVWKSTPYSGDTYSDFYTDYFGYINVMYTPGQVEALIQNIFANAEKEDEFSIFKYKVLRGQISLLYDLVGTKYIRQNKLTKALVNFRKVEKKLWSDKYSDWEREQSNGSWTQGNALFDKNPFFELNYTPNFIPLQDTMRLNKYTITKQLIRYLNKANNVKEKNRDYYYFLAANCYYNMTQFGNCWMMRRYFWSSSGNFSKLEDEAEFNECNSAKTYYLLALKNAKTDKFRALCLRMIGRCEKNKLEYRYHDEDRYGENRISEDSLYGSNRYYMDLKTKYPKYFKDLTSDCSFFEDYFKARR